MSMVTGIGDVFLFLASAASGSSAGEQSLIDAFETSGGLDIDGWRFLYVG